MYHSGAWTLWAYRLLVDIRAGDAPRFASRCCKVPLVYVGGERERASEPRLETLPSNICMHIHLHVHMHLNI